ncbi:MAG: LCP family protein [Christensenellales bacterium]
MSNILVLLQDGGETDTMMIASINSRTGRSVMLRVNCDLTVDVPENGETRLADVYALGAKKSRGLLAERAVNTLLGLNIGTYVALDVTNLPELVDADGHREHGAGRTREAEPRWVWIAGWNDLTGDEALAYVRLQP